MENLYIDKAGVKTHRYLSTTIAPPPPSAEIKGMVHHTFFLLMV